MACDHPNFAASVNVGRLTDENGFVTHYTADVSIHCSSCGRRMRFVGLPGGVDLNGATVSADGLEARLAIHPHNGLELRIPRPNETKH